MIRTLALVLLAALAMAGCSSNPNAIEPVDLERFKKEYKVKRIWRSGAGDGTEERAVWMRPALSGERIFAADVDGRVYAFTTDRGKRQWKVKLREPVSAGVAAGYGLVLVGTRAGELVALEAEDGALRWRASLSSELLAPPALGDGLVIAQTLDGRVSAFAVETGEPVWQYESVVPVLTLRGTAEPLVEGDRVYIGFASGKVAALDLDTGVPLWEQRVAEPTGRSELDRLVDVDGSLIVEGGAVFAATFQGKLAVMDQDSGRVFWDKDMSVYRAMDSEDGTLYLSDALSRVHAVDQRASSTLWKQDGLYGRGSTGVVVQDGLVVTGDQDGYLHWMDPADGRFVARRRHDRDPFAGSLLERAGVLYALSADGRLAAYRLVPRN